jgi:hypothetical protein
MARSDRDFVLDEEGIPSRARHALRLVLERPVEVAGLVTMAAAAAAILVNALFLQEGMHPAPLFREAAVAPAAVNAPPLPPARQAVSPQTQALVRDIQVELAGRGHDVGDIDGVPGPKTDAAIRAFQSHAGLVVDGQPSAALLARLRSASVPEATDPIGKLIETEAPPLNPRNLAIERALSDYGYGQLKVDGVIDPDTRAAIERYERDRNWPVTGQVSQRLIQDLVRMTGTPIE